MNQLKLANKNIVISAAADGIGWCIAEFCLNEGANVFISDINQNKIELRKQHIKYNKNLFIHNVDTSESTKVREYFEELKRNINSIDALINNVGIQGPTGRLEDLEIEDWCNTLNININSHFYYAKNAIPLLKINGGSIINLSSTAGIFGFPLRSPYSASKWAVVGMTKTLAMELGKFKIRVNAICPGTIKGDRMIRVIRDKANFLKISKKKVEKEFVSMASMNCWINEEDIGKTCSFLISSDGEKISGQTIPVDGNATRMD